MLNERHIALLDARGIDPELAARLGVESFDKAGGEWVRIPYVEGDAVVNWKYRTIEGEKRFYQENGGRKCFWNCNAIVDSTLAGEPLIVTEGEFDAMAAMQAGYRRVVSVPDGAPAEAQGEAEGAKYSYVLDALSALHDVREIILCSDGDGPGINLMNDLAVRLGRVRCKWVKYPEGCKDLNDALAKYGERGVTETIARAQWMRVDSVYRLSELPPVTAPSRHTSGVLEDHYRVRLGDFCVVTGIPGHGKSTFINEVACHLVERYDWTVAFASFEQQPQVDHRRALRTRFHRKLEIDMTDDEKSEADAWIDQHFSFIVPSEDDDVTLEWVLERSAASVIQHGARLVVIDPWNEMDHDRPSDMSLTEYTGFAIKQFRKLARKHNVHVVVAAHPTKQRKSEDGKLLMPSLYDISDSAHWFNKADIGIVVHRLDGDRTVLRVAKTRYHDQIGVPGEIIARFVVSEGRYMALPPVPKAA